MRQHGCVSRCCVMCECNVDEPGTGTGSERLPFAHLRIFSEPVPALASARDRPSRAYGMPTTCTGDADAPFFVPVPSAPDMLSPQHETDVAFHAHVWLIPAVTPTILVSPVATGDAVWPVPEPFP